MMTFETIVHLCDDLDERVGFVASNTVGHLVTQDWNFENHNILFQLKWACDNQEDIIREGMVTQAEFDEVIRFLCALMLIPEEERLRDSWYAEEGVNDL